MTSDAFARASQFCGRAPLYGLLIIMALNSANHFVELSTICRYCILAPTVVIIYTTPCFAIAAIALGVTALRMLRRAPSTFDSASIDRTRAMAWTGIKFGAVLVFAFGWRFTGFFA